MSLLAPFNISKYRIWQHLPSDTSFYRLLLFLGFLIYNIFSQWCKFCLELKGHFTVMASGVFHQKTPLLKLSMGWDMWVSLVMESTFCEIFWRKGLLYRSCSIFFSTSLDLNLYFCFSCCKKSNKKKPYLHDVWPRTAVPPDQFTSVSTWAWVFCSTLVSSPGGLRTFSCTSFSVISSKTWSHHPRLLQFPRVEYLPSGFLTFFCFLNLYLAFKWVIHNIQNLCVSNE